MSPGTSESGLLPQEPLLPEEGPQVGAAPRCQESSKLEGFPGNLETVSEGRRGAG